MESQHALEIAFLCISIAIFGGYHLWLFWIAVRVFPSKNKSNMFYVNRQARVAWAHEVSRNTDAAAQTYIAQILRNSITASSLLATACSLIAVQGVGNIVLDNTKLQTLDNLVRKDPILKGGNGIISPALKLGIIEVMVWFTFLFFTQSIRLAVNMVNLLQISLLLELICLHGFYARSVHSEENEGFYTEDELAAISKRSAICFTLGMRFFYALIPLIFWIAGPTWMLIVTALLVFCIYLTDHVKAIPSQQKSKQRQEDVEALRKTKSKPAQNAGDMKALND